MVWCLMALGVIWLLVRRHWRPALWLGLPTVLIFLLGSTRLAENLVAAEEEQWGRRTEDGRRKTEDGAERGDHGPLTTDHGLRTEDGRRKTEDGGRRTEDGLRTTDLSPSNAVNGHSSVVNGQTSRPADAVVALGGGDRISTCDILGFAVSDGGSRLLTAIELVRTGQASNLVLGGSWPLPANPKLPSMIVLQQWVLSWGLVTNPVTNLGICVNTHDEALAYQLLSTNQGWKSLILVTSALHMRRSLALFRKLGLEVTPVAADFQVYGVPQEMPFSPFPRQRPFHLLSLYLHEQIGWWVYRGRGWV
jgi:uncharacterized SAM-binding protein YcdF (DUF218 family)